MAGKHEPKHNSQQGIRVRFQLFQSIHTAPLIKLMVAWIIASGVIAAVWRIQNYTLSVHRRAYKFPIIPNSQKPQALVVLSAWATISESG
jgi:hypothetical protein